MSASIRTFLPSICTNPQLSNFLIGTKFRGSLRFQTQARNIFEWPDATKGVEAAVTPPSSWYTNPMFYDQVERQFTFRRWLIVGRVAQLKAEGDYLATTIAHQPVVILRHEGKLRAFYNVCRHHAAQLCDEGQGSLGPAGRITCPYHGWQYTQDGRLAKAVKMAGCKDFSAKNFGLISLPVAEIGPWIYADFSGKTATQAEESKEDIFTALPDLASTLKTLLDDDFPQLEHVASKSYEIDCNWKVYIDNYLDGGYHVPVAHKGLSQSLDLPNYSRSGTHNFYLQTCPSQEPVGNTANSLAKDRLKGRGAVYLFQYPNICINRYGDWLDTNIVYPLTTDRCVVHFDWFVHKKHLDNQAMIDECIHQSDIVQQEDVWLCKRVQSGLQSHGYDVGRYAPSLEGGEYLFHQRLYEDFKNSTLFSRSE